jgi:hypothetical protein
MLATPGSLREYRLLKLQRLQNMVLRTIGSFPRRTSVVDMHVAFQIPYVYDYIKTHAGKEHKSSNIMKMKMFATLDKSNPDRQNIRGLNLAEVMCTNVEVSRLP